MNVNNRVAPAGNNNNIDDDTDPELWGAVPSSPKKQNKLQATLAFWEIPPGAIISVILVVAGVVAVVLLGGGDSTVDTTFEHPTCKVGYTRPDDGFDCTLCDIGYTRSWDGSKCELDPCPPEGCGFASRCVKITNTGYECICEIRRSEKIIGAEPSDICYESCEAEGYIRLADGSDCTLKPCGDGYIRAEDGVSCVLGKATTAPCEKGYTRSEDGVSCSIVICETGHVRSDDFQLWGGSVCIIEACEAGGHERSADGSACILKCPPDHVKTPDGQSCKQIVACGPSADQSVMGEQKLNNLHGGLGHQIQSGDMFGNAVAPMGDLDGNGVVDFAVGAPRADSSGSVYIIFLKSDHTVMRETRLGTTSDGKNTVGGLLHPMHANDVFGLSLASLGDLDGDGVADLLVGATGDDDGGKNRGALYVLFALATGEVKAQQKISSTQGGGGQGLLHLDDGAKLGLTISAVGGVDRENGVVDVVVVGKYDVYLMQLNLDGTLKSSALLVEGGDVEGVAGGVAGVGDLDGNGVVDIVIGAPYENDMVGAVFVLLMQPGGSMLSRQRTNAKDVGVPLEKRAHFGWSVAGLGDLDGDGTPDLAVGAIHNYNHNGGPGRGSVHILLLRKNGAVKGHHVISSSQGGLVGPLAGRELFGHSVATLVERADSEEGVVTLAVGASKDTEAADIVGGAVYILQLPSGFVEVCPGANEQCIHRGGSYTCVDTGGGG